MNKTKHPQVKELQPFSGKVFCPHPTDRSERDAVKRCVIYAYSKHHASEMAFMFLPRQKSSDRFAGIKRGCKDSELSYGAYPGVYVDLPGSSTHVYERLEHYFMKPQTCSKNTQRKLGISIGTTYTAAGESRTVKTLTALPEHLEALALFENGDGFEVYYADQNGKQRHCSVAEFHKWRGESNARATERYATLLSLRRKERALVDAACGTLATAQGGGGVGDFVNKVTVRDILTAYEDAGGDPRCLTSAINSARYCDLIRFSGPSIKGAAVSPDFKFSVTAKGWCHWSKWKDEMILSVKGAWPEKTLGYIRPEVRKVFLSSRPSYNSLNTKV